MGKPVYVFLDIDGVLNKESQWKHMFTLDHGCMKEFADYMNELESIPKIILTSTWKNGYNKNGTHSKPIQQLIDILHEYGIHIIGKTENNDKGDRAKEINDYIKRHKLEKHNIIVIDDDVDIFKSRLLPNVRFILSDSKTGFRKESVPIHSQTERFMKFIKTVFNLGL